MIIRLGSWKPASICAVIGIACVGAWAGAFAAEQSQAEIAFAMLQDSVKQLRPAPGDSAPADAAWNDTVTRIGAANAELQRRFAARKIASDRYARTIVSDATAIEGARSEDLPRRPRVRSAMADLEAKVAYAKTTLGAATSLGNDLNVRVKTVDKSGAERNGFEVKANAFGEPNADPPQVIFSTRTPTSALPFAPGYYVFWVEHNGKRGSHQTQKIGTTSDPVQLVILTADVQ